jgi:hypothetical protein
MQYACTHVWYDGQCTYKIMQELGWQKHKHFIMYLNYKWGLSHTLSRELLRIKEKILWSSDIKNQEWIINFTVLFIWVISFSDVYVS